MKFFLILICVISGVYSQISLEPSKIDTEEIRAALLFNDKFTDKQLKALKVHKALAFTTGGLLLASDAIGTYHFLSMKNKGHDYRDEHGYNESNMDEAARTNEIKSVWNEKESQSERVLHAALISASTVCYVATATIELTLPRIDDNPSKYSKPNIHRRLFFCHAALMLANIGLGLAESYELSQGNHDMVVGLGVTHMIVGIAAPVVMIGSGLVFKL